MNRTVAALVVAALLASGASALPPVEDALLSAWSGIHADAIARHIAVLASDKYEGRSPGTRGETLTLAYVEQQFKDAGLVPWSADGYRQEVPLTRATITGKPAFSYRAKGKKVSLTLMEQFVPRLARPIERVSIANSEMVFVGHGIVAPEYQWDDLAGADLAGKTVVVLAGDPGAEDTTLFAGRTGTRYASPQSKYLELARHGVRAAVVVHTERSAGYPWITLSGGGLGKGQYYLPPEKNDPALESVVVVSEPVARAMFQAASRDFDRDVTAGHTRGFRAQPFGATCDIAVQATVEDIVSHNLIGLVKGSGAPDEAVLLMAHWDHMGRDSTRQGDQIFNGAVDNATGVAAVIEIARAFKAMPRAPRRTVAIIATTAEERGLLGAEWLARHPIVPLPKIAAACAVDALFPYGKEERMSVTGFGNSELEDVLAAAAARVGRTLQGDGDPQAGTFFRADNYPFCKRGVPGFLAVGGPDIAKPDDDPQMAKFVNYGQTKYHQPADEYDAKTWEMEGIEQDARVMFEFAWRVADDTRMPNWRWNSAYRAIGDERLRGTAAGGGTPAAGRAP